MTFFDKFNRNNINSSLSVNDDEIVAIADGEIIDIHKVDDVTFSRELIGKSIAFKIVGDKVLLCSPANGTLTLVFPTGHAYGVTTNEGIEILVHCGIETVNAKGDGFKTLKSQGEQVKAGDPIVEVNYKKLSKKYDMSTILIISNANGRKIDFLPPQPILRGQSLIK